jgi:outer membrane protein assembly factor BamB
MKWRFAVAADIEGAAAISTDGVIYFGCEDSLLYAVDTGGTLRWRHRFSHGLWTRCAIGPDGTVYCDDGCDSLFALQPDGTVKWSVKATGFAGIAIGADGTIYCSTTEDGRNYMCAWAPDGSERWRCECGTWSWNSPAIGSDGTIYFGAREGIFAIAPEGTRKWMYRTGHIASTAAVRADSVVCVGSVDGCFYALNPDGTLRWRLRVLDAGIYEVPTVITQDGTILFVSDGHVLNAVHGTSPLADSPWPKFQRDLANSGRAGGR